MKLGTKVGLVPGDIVLDRDPAPPKRGHSPQFSVHVYCGQTVAHLGCCWALVLLYAVAVEKKHLMKQWVTCRPSLWCEIGSQSYGGSEVKALIWYTTRRTHTPAHTHVQATVAVNLMHLHRQNACRGCEVTCKRADLLNRKVSTNPTIWTRRSRAARGNVSPVLTATGFVSGKGQI